MPNNKMKDGRVKNRNKEAMKSFHPSAEAKNIFKGELAPQKSGNRSRVTKAGLSAEQELFCQYYATDREFFGNGIESYAEATGKDLSDIKQYRICNAQAVRWLKNPHILKRINELLELGGLNDEFVDKQLALVITQNADFPSKLGAIKEYNKLRGRIIEKQLKLNANLPEPLLGGDARAALNRRKQHLDAIEATVIEEAKSIKPSDADQIIEEILDEADHQEAEQQKTTPTKVEVVASERVITVKKAKR